MAIPGEGILSCIGYVDMCGAKGVWFLGLFGQKCRGDFDPFGLKEGIVGLELELGMIFTSKMELNAYTTPT